MCVYIYFNIDQIYQRELLSKRNGKEENDPNYHSDQGTPRGITRRVPPIGIQIKEGEMGKKHYSKFSSLLLMVEIHKNTDMHVQPLSF